MSGNVRHFRIRSKIQIQIGAEINDAICGRNCTYSFHQLVPEEINVGKEDR